MYTQKEIIFDIETTSLDPLENDDARVVAIGVKCGDYEDVLMSTKESELLREFWNLPFFEGYFRLIGFNSFNFDIPYLIIRSFKHNIKVPDIKGRSIDLRFILSYGNKFQKGTLEDYSKLILGNNGTKLKDTSGNGIKNLWNQGDFEKIKAYCKQDIFLTSKIHERLKIIGMLK